MRKTKKVLAFESMTPAEKRVAIAKDVLKHIKAHKLAVNTRSYFNLGETCEEGDDLRKLIIGSDKPCTVCAKGAIFAVKAIEYNEIEISRTHGRYFDGGYIPNAPYIEDEDIISAMDGIFEPFQLDLIEAAFEMVNVKDMNYVDDPDNSTEDQDKYNEIMEATRKYKSMGYDSTIRLTLIMQNIINNGGTFVV